MSSSTPTVGRVVHYVARGSADGRFPPVCRAAVVTEVADPTVRHYNGAGKVTLEYSPPASRHQVGLAVLNPSGTFFHPLEMGGVTYDAGTDPDDVAETCPIAPAGPLCDDMHYQPGSWHWPARVGADS